MKLKPQKYTSFDVEQGYYWVKDIFGSWNIVDVYLSATGYRIRGMLELQPTFLIQGSYFEDKDFYGPIVLDIEE